MPVAGEQTLVDAHAASEPRSIERERRKTTDVVLIGFCIDIAESELLSRGDIAM